MGRAPHAGGLERAVDLHHVQMLHARSQVLRQNAEPAADLQDDVGGARAPRRVR